MMTLVREEVVREFGDEYALGRESVEEAKQWAANAQKEWGLVDAQWTWYFDRYTTFSLWSMEHTENSPEEYFLIREIITKCTKEEPQLKMLAELLFAGHADEEIAKRMGVEVTQVEKLRRELERRIRQQLR